MKKWIVLSLICAAGVISCGKKVMPDSGAGNRSKSENSKEAKNGTQSANTNASSNTTPSLNNMQRSAPNNENARSVSMENGKSVFVTKCGGCHALKNPGDYTMDQMNTILKTEIPKAKLSSKEAEEVTAYLLANTKK
jgi:mono/diheme cytochrome c family protein